MSGRVQGLRALITGAASGIGRATGERLAREGARVALLDVDRDGLALVASGIGDAALSVRCDVRSEAEVAAAVAEAVAAWGGLDVLVANAGIELIDGGDSRVHELEIAAWQRTIDVNLTGVFLTCKHGIRALLDSGGGSVICTASPSSFFGVAVAEHAYTASKGGVASLVRVMAADYARDGIRVNGVVPGFTNTPLNGPVFQDEAAVAAIVATIPLARPGEADEVASVMLFLASPESAYVTGAFFTVDGGMTAI